MIEIMNVTKNYGKVVGADDVSLTAQPGEITVLLGANGAGKSTTIKSVTGLLKYEGKIRICGFDNRSPEAKKRFGYIPETPLLYDVLTVQEHINFIGNAYNVDGYKGIGDEYLTLFHLTDKRKTIAKELSKGMRQKLSMILALIPQPKALLVDEPLMGLDPASIEQTLELLMALKKKDVSILLSTHIIDVVDHIWDRAYIMKKGRILLNVGRSELDGRNLKDIFFEYGSEEAEYEGTD